jgi:thioredoxin-like negative regulator of GroEL
MDWTTMSGLYGDAEAYTTQLRALEARCRKERQDAAAAFVLAYHYLVIGNSDSAVNALNHVVSLKPGDLVAKKMLAALSSNFPLTRIVSSPGRQPQKVSQPSP